MSDIRSLLSCILYLFVTMAMVSSCGKGANGDDGKGGGGNEDHELSREVEAFTGARTKMVWAQYQNLDVTKNDPLVNGRVHNLWGFDTGDGLGPREILKEKSSYGRPLISADGERILFTYKEYEKDGDWKRNWKLVIYAVDWNGTNIVELGKGYAVDVWKDPRTGIQWVYAAQDFQDTERMATYAKKVVRFQLDDPEKVELIWDQTPVTPDNFQISGDGLRAASLFPWPDMGVIDLSKGEWTKYTNGCWPSMAPDNSYLSWVFDGAHANVHMILDGGEKTWEVPINRSQFIKGRQVYHPRWSNHVRFFIFTGPYVQPPEGGNPITRGTRKAEVNIGRFNERMDAVEASLLITHSSLPDYMPDLWIEGGEKVSLDMSQVGPEEGMNALEEGADELSWPVETDGLIFTWKDSGSTNDVAEADGSRRKCVLEAVGGARYFRNLEMDCGGGLFRADEVSSELVNGLIGSGKAMSLELQFWPDGEGTGTIMRGESFALQQRGRSLEFVVGGAVPASISVPDIDPSYAHQVAIIFDGETWEMVVDGEDRDPDEGESTLEKGDGLQFGGDWAGKIKGVAVYDRALTLEEVTAAHHYWETKTVQGVPVPRIKVKATLVEATPVPSVESLTQEPYPRALVVYTYQVDEVVDGEFENDKMLVRHWAILDEEVVAGFPREVGKQYELELEPASAHSQLKAERQFDHSSDFTLEVFYDVSTPAF